MEIDEKATNYGLRRFDRDATVLLFTDLGARASSSHARWSVGFLSSRSNNCSPRGLLCLPRGTLFLLAIGNKLSSSALGQELHSRNTIFVKQGERPSSRFKHPQKFPTRGDK